MLIQMQTSLSNFCHMHILFFLSLIFALAPKTIRTLQTELLSSDSIKKMILNDDRISSDEKNFCVQEHKYVTWCSNPWSLTGTH